MIDIYREPSAQLITAPFKPWQGIILDRGVLQKAVKNSRNEFIFSEHGAGIQPLVVIGTMPELIEFFYKNQNVIISNEIQALPEFYIGVSKFVEKKRYDGTFPLGDAISAISKSILDFVPGSKIIDVLSNASTFASILKELTSGKSKEKKSEILYLKISYLNDFENNGKKIGSKKITFDVILRYLLGVQETPV